MSLIQTRKHRSYGAPSALEYSSSPHSSSSISSAGCFFPFCFFSFCFLGFSCTREESVSHGRIPGIGANGRRGWSNPAERSSAISLSSAPWSRGGSTHPTLLLDILGDLGDDVLAVEEIELAAVLRRRGFSRVEEHPSPSAEKLTSCKARAHMYLLLRTCCATPPGERYMRSSISTSPSSTPSTFNASSPEIARYETGVFSMILSATEKMRGL